uniref:Uncharacterized protein n=1 Tax=Arundo donax TaxID=35708 RepID=A0A0A8XSQ4_ARUDO
MLCCRRCPLLVPVFVDTSPHNISPPWSSSLSSS